MRFSTKFFSSWQDVKVGHKDSGLPPHDPSLGNFDLNTLQVWFFDAI